MKLSLAMIVKNEERNIALCIEHVQKYVDEIVVADTGSTDRTKEIVSQLPVRLLHIPWQNSFAAARNAVIAETTGDWVLVLDADEMVLSFDESAVHSFIEKEQIGQIRITSEFVDEAGAKKQAVQYVSRLFPRRFRFTGIIHEQLASDLPRVPIPIHVRHSGYYLTEKAGRNLPLLLQALTEQPNHPYYCYQTAREYRNLKDWPRSLQYYEIFFQNREEQYAYTKEAIVEYLYALLHAKQYERMLQVMEQTEHVMKHYPDFYFVCGLFYMEYIQEDMENRMHLMPEIAHSFEKCLEIGDEKKVGGVVGTGTFLAAYNLGLYYELMDGLVADSKEKARTAYREAERYGYQPAIERLNRL
ncbi:glycosyltransferase family 2 protein [Ectobacillus ponti]|uniref:Glycosyltransferase family 2 protein n=1 Tax=Ectobacillus ponti TaxID=2961894 RepID=A0AA42BQV6_9BACI|nr:glycosyltransferase family 2 protein [Ectobacillus ponti]MCP8968859.1 glycosyltransferase family 2 protein [Ectobacillus ponti]